MKKCSWIIADATQNEMRCKRCGEAESLDIMMGKRLDFACGIMKAFVEVHSKCKGDNNYE